MKCGTRAVKKSAVYIIAAIVVIVSGCASRQLPDMSKGTVACCYESKIKPADGSAQKTPVSLSIHALEKDPYESHISPRLILSFIPILSFINMAMPTGTAVNVDYSRINGASAETANKDNSNANSHNSPKQTRPGHGDHNNGKKQREVEDILKQEIAKSGIVRDVSLSEEGKKADYEIKGSVNFIGNVYIHASGLGFLYVGLLPMFTLPTSSQEAVCKAHFDVVSKKTGAAILSKDYSAKRSYAQGLVYNGDVKALAAFGKEVFPEVVEEFIADMQALPKDAWKR